MSTAPSGLINHGPVEKHQGVQRLNLGACRDITSNRKVGKKLAYLDSAHLPGMTLVMEYDKPPDPVHVGLFRSYTVMAYPDRADDFIQKG